MDFHSTIRWISFQNCNYFTSSCATQQHCAKIWRQKFLEFDSHSLFFFSFSVLVYLHVLYLILRTVYFGMSRIASSLSLLVVRSTNWNSSITGKMKSVPVIFFVFWAVNSLLCKPSNAWPEQACIFGFGLDAEKSRRRISGKLLSLFLDSLVVLVLVIVTLSFGSLLIDWARMLFASDQ